MALLCVFYILLDSQFITAETNTGVKFPKSSDDYWPLIGGNGSLICYMYLIAGVHELCTDSH